MKMCIAGRYSFTDFLMWKRQKVS